MSTNKESASNAKFLLVFVSITAILGLWMVFAGKTERAAVNENAQPQPIVSGQIYYPEMPTLVPMVELNQQIADFQSVQPVQELRTVSVPTPAMQQAAPQVSIQSIIVGGSPSSGGGGSSSSQQPAQTTTKAS